MCPCMAELRLPLTYYGNIPVAPELGQVRKIDIGHLREIRKRLDTGFVPVSELEMIAVECLDEIVELCNGKEGRKKKQNLVWNQ